MVWKVKRWERCVWVTLLLSVFFIQFKIPGLTESVQAKENDNFDKYLNIFSRTLQQIRERYVEPEKTTYRNLIYGAIKGMLSELSDPHTSFLDQKTFSKLRENTKGSFGGLGIYIQKRDEWIVVINPMEETPAAEVGIKPGDIIAEIEGEDAYGISLEEAVGKLKGPKGSTVNIKVIRQGEEKPLSFKITRAEIKIQSVVHAMIKESKVGYVKVRTFSQNTVGDMKKAISKLKKEGMDSVIIDLRYNPGGLLSEVIKAVDLFIDEGKIVYTKDKSGRVGAYPDAQKSIILPKYIPMVILINNYSASASEIFSGAMQDHERAILIGEKTFGKFSVQEVFNIDHTDSTAFKLTVAKYYLPSGRSLSEEGIAPDIEVAASVYTPYEVKMINKQKTKEIINGYVKKYPKAEADEKHLGEVMQKLAEEDLNISRSTASFLVARKRSESEPPAKYDLKFDNQLQEAMKAIKSHKIFSKKE